MSNTDSQAMPFHKRNRLSDQAKATSPGGHEEIRWEVVARTPGYTPATILAGRLQAEGIPVRIWQEGAGQALGLTVGILGTGHVAVPEEYARQAREILGDEDQADIDTDDTDDVQVS
jgi:hypothetical protein